ncbi:MAG: terminase small subunit [Oscillospiraceae bacterium]|jgi:hypothetical protein|nr:terminase small subunit [Oscillospiraceae bacterium]
MQFLSDKRRFVSAYLRSFDAQHAAQAIGKLDGVKLLASPAVQRELSLQRGQCAPSKSDVVRRLAQLAFGRANDCVRLVLEENPNIDSLDLSLLSELKRNDKGTVEIKLLDRVRALELLLESGAEDTDCAAAFFAAAEEGDENEIL